MTNLSNTSISDEDIQTAYKKIGQNVKKIRQMKKASQLQLAMAIGHKAVGTISMAELCTNKKHFNIEHLIKIADVLGVSVCDFFEGL